MCIRDSIKTAQVDQIKDAMEQSLAPGCQTFEQALYALYKSGTISLKEALAHADSATNLSWLIDNDKLTGAVDPNAPTTEELSCIKLNL